MEFALDKCAIAIMKGGKQIKSQNMQTDDKVAYKYLDIDENSGNRHSAMEEIAKEYYRTVRFILRSEFNFKNKLIQNKNPTLKSKSNPYLLDFHSEFN